MKVVRSFPSVHFNRVQNTRGSILLAACLSLGLSAIEPGFTATPPKITTASLLRQMTDLKAMAEFPKPFYTCKQFSSYDRKSKSPAEEWFANGDSGQYLRVEERSGRKEFVMVDTAGPGAIVRIWSANPEGTLRIYLDGSSEPVLESPMPTLLGGNYPGLPKPLAGEYSKGWNLYLPIPYARHCKITSDKGGFYYHVNYRTYESGTPVESFQATALKALAPQLENIAAQLSDPARAIEPAGGEPFEMELQPGQVFQTDIEGPQAVTQAVLTVQARDIEAALRGIILSARFDGEPTIEAPLGDFFGSAPGINPFATLPLGMRKDGQMYSRWWMPFRENAVFEFKNASSQDVRIAGEAVLEEYSWTDRSMHFHAKWRAQFDVPTRPMQDWNYLTAQGQGVFAGVSFSIDNPVKDWWGEGDEKIYVDSESFPSHFGTGTEDYYGYAWCWPALFTHAYHAQPRCDGPGNYGRTSVNRFHILDRIPFQKDFKFDMELWHWHQTCQVNMAAIAYWYARPGASDGFDPIQTKDTVVRPMPVYVVPRVAGAIEGETMAIKHVTGVVEPQDWDSVSAGRHLWWRQGMKPGDHLALSFAAPKAGKYRILGHFLRARDYGIHQLAINGSKAGEPIDFFNPSVQPTKEIDLGVFELKEENELDVTVSGANPQAIKAFMFGLDYLRLNPVE